jgi:ubiquinone biosynthesis protein Coq4
VKGRNRIRFRDARAALRKLQADPHQTDAVFEVVEALAGSQPQRLLERIRRDPDGGRLLHERPLFDPRHADMEALERLPEGTFGF